MSFIVFVAGVHGVGKTTIGRRLAALLPGRQVSAGALIAEGDPRLPVTVSERSKAVADVSGNQVRLLRGLASFRSRTSGHIVLDGHLCVLTPDGTVRDVGLDVLEAINPGAIVLVESAPEVIYARLSARNADVPSVQAIDLLSARERGCAQSVAASLAVHLVQLRGDGDPDQAAQLAWRELKEVVDSR